MEVSLQVVHLFTTIRIERCGVESSFKKGKSSKQLLLNIIVDGGRSIVLDSDYAINTQLQE